MRKRDLAARIEALEKRVRTGADYEVMQDQINKLRANMDGRWHPGGLLSKPEPILTPEQSAAYQKLSDAAKVDWGADLPPNGPTVQLPADSDALIDTSDEDPDVKLISTVIRMNTWYTDHDEAIGIAQKVLDALATYGSLFAVDELRGELAAANEHIAAQDSEIAAMRKDRDAAEDNFANLNSMLSATTKERDEHQFAREVLYKRWQASVAAHARTKELLGDVRKERDFEDARADKAEAERDEARRIAELMRPHVLNPFAKTLPWVSDDDDEGNFKRAFE